ncbi:MAG: DNA polymerase I [Desulfuromonas sp.]|nr:MAG: DNA polymerase I [Desulfuromonas sp.]
MSESTGKLYLIDGSSYIYRAYYAVRHLSNSKGEPTNAVFGFANMLLKILRDEKPEHIAVVFDSKAPTFRKEMYPEYKANRAAMPDDLVPQIPLIKELVAGFNIPCIEKPGYEADDIMATLAKQFSADNYDVVVVTGDKDMMQIVSDKVSLLDTMKDKRSGPEEVAERFGGTPDKVIEVQALAGDSSDNVPGIPGIGEKTAVALIKEFGTVENLLANLDQLKGKRRENLENFGDLALISKKLVTLIDDVPLDGDEDYPLGEPDNDALTDLFKRLEFYKLLQEFSVIDQASGENYHCVLNQEQFDALLGKLESADRFAFDTETTSLIATRADLVGFSFAVEPGEAWYLPVGHSYLGAPDQLDRQQVVDTLKPLLENPDKAKIGQNVKYDALVLRRGGINIKGVTCDTMLASYLANPASKSHGMDALAADLLDYRTIPYSEVAGSGKKQICFSEVEIEKATVYAAEDADITLRLAEKLEPMVKSEEQERLFHDVEMPLMEILTDMEWTGVRIDAEFLGGLSVEMKGKLAELEEEIHALAGVNFNIGSPKQLGDVLFEHLQLPRGKKTKTGWSTNVEVLTNLAQEHEIAARILDYRSVSKLKSTYSDALPKIVNPETGRIHTSFNQAITATGRLSSSEPNLQNIPIRTEEGRRIREAFIASDGNIIISADYSQVELRVLAHMADEPTLKESFAANEDIHVRTASEVFNVFPEMVTPEQRRQAKTINFGVIYGMGAFSLGKDLGIKPKEAQVFIDNYFARYSHIKSFMESCREEARARKYVTTLLGRRCAIPEIDSSNGAVRSYAERNAINYPIQGSAADIIKVAMINIARRLEEEGLNAKMVIQVHDELVFDVPASEADTVKSLIKEEMENAVPISVPLLVEVGAGKNWHEAH